jgi:hypothetical protein
MAGMRFGGKPQPPTWLAMLHGFLSAAALTLLRSAPPTAPTPPPRIYVGYRTEPLLGMLQTCGHAFESVLTHSIQLCLLPYITRICIPSVSLLSLKV